MAETDTPQPMTDHDIVPPPTSTAFEPAAPLKDAGVDFTPETEAPSAAEVKRDTIAAGGSNASPAGGGTIAGAKQTVTDGAASLQQQAFDKARLFAEDGKEKAGGALDQLAQMLLDAAAQVDEKLGAQYGDHARTAASSVQGFAETVRNKNIDELADDVRGYVRKSPAAAVGVTAALGFALARLVHSGIDQRA